MGGFLFAVAPAPGLGLGTSSVPAPAPTSEHARADVWDHVIPVNPESGGRNFLKKGLYSFRLPTDNQSTQGEQPPLPHTDYDNDDK